MLNPFKNARGLLANAIYSSYSSPTNSPGQRGERSRGTSTSSWSPPSTFTWTSMTWTTSSTGRWPTGSKHLSNTTNLRNFLVKTEFWLPTTLRTGRPGGAAPLWRGAGGVHKVQFVSLKSLIYSFLLSTRNFGEKNKHLAKGKTKEAAWWEFYNFRQS